MYETITLSNGIRLVYERMPGVRSAALGIWIGAGSRNERREEAGSAHFIEHMLFKGTASRSATELAALMDGIGGQCNAFTTRDSTCLYARVLDSRLDDAADILADMFLHSLFAPADMENERGVILEEIDMYEDTPEDVVTEQLIGKCFPGALGRPVLGRSSSLFRISCEGLRAFKAREYRPERVVVALCGSFTDSQLRRLAARFEPMERAAATRFRRCAYRPATVLRKKTTEQNHLCLAWEGLPIGSVDRFAWQIMSTVFGEGLSSRLFQSVREKHGLCYSIGSFTASYAETGLFGISTAVGKDVELRALSLIRDEVEKLRQDGVTRAELDRARELILANLVMGMESTAARMNRLGASVLQLGSCLSVEEVAARYAAVTEADVARLAASMLRPEALSLSVVGRPADEEEYRAVLA